MSTPSQSSWRFVSPNSLLGAYQPQTQAARLLLNMLAVVVMVLAIIIGAKISVPVWPVPVTLQSFVVALLAACVGAKLGVVSVFLYLSLGALGLPVFAAGGALSYLTGPTSGFLIGFLVLAAIVGNAVDRGASARPFLLFAKMVAGSLIVLAAGFIWLVLTASGHQWVDQTQLMGSAFATAIQPFIVWDILKMALAALIVSGAWAMLVARR